MENKVLNKTDFAVIIGVDGANPNGDPMDGNKPRTDINGYGIISQVCLKRKIRDRGQENGQKIFVQSNDNRTDEYMSLKSRASSILQKGMTMEEIVQKACQEWFDVKMFGAVMAYKENKDKNENSVSIGIKCCVSLRSAISSTTGR